MRSIFLLGLLCLPLLWALPMGGGRSEKGWVALIGEPELPPEVPNDPLPDRGNDKDEEEPVPAEPAPAQPAPAEPTPDEPAKGTLSPSQYVALTASITLITVYVVYWVLRVLYATLQDRRGSYVPLHPEDIIPEPLLHPTLPSMPKLSEEESIAQAIRNKLDEAKPTSGKPIPFRLPGLGSKK